jgi:hypothetical protein
MPNPNDSRNQPPVPGTVTGATPSAANGGIPIAPGATNAAPPNTQASGADKSPAAASGQRAKVKCLALKGKEVSIRGEIVKVDENGILEVDAKQAERLLKIPGYEKA